jgi:hypothetical protein
MARELNNGGRHWCREGSSTSRELEHHRPWEREEERNIDPLRKREDSWALNWRRARPDLGPGRWRAWLLAASRGRAQQRAPRGKGLRLGHGEEREAKKSRGWGHAMGKKLRATARKSHAQAQRTTARRDAASRERWVEEGASREEARWRREPWRAPRNSAGRGGLEHRDGENGEDKHGQEISKVRKNGGGKIRNARAVSEKNQGWRAAIGIEIDWFLLEQLDLYH